MSIHKSLVRSYHNTLSWCSNYFVSKTHVLSTGLRRGQWHDVPKTLLHGTMTALVDFIEIEQAWMYAISDEDLYKALPWWVKFSPTRAFIHWRSPTLGLSRLEWERNLRFSEDDPDGKLSDQALSAQAQLELYMWWKTRPSRPDIHELSNDEAAAVIKLKYPTLIEKYPGEAGWFMLDRAYDEEDTAALHRLINIRNHLWT